MSSGYSDGPAPSPGSRGHAVVTGGASGIGWATALALDARGFDVTVVSLEDGLPSGQRRIGYLQADISDISTHAAIVAAVAKPICLVNCAGVTSLMRGDMLDLTPESFDRVMSVNLRGTFFLTQAFARRMLTHADDGGYRSIISVGSINADVVGENRADYCMSKAALAMMSKLFAARLAERGIMVHEVRPGVIRTQMTAGAKQKYDGLIDDGGVPMNRWGEPEDVAAAIAALASGAFPYATGMSIDIAGGLQLHRV
ncbi:MULTISPECIES: 3-ketoacyl-ACP reductase [unclassified Sinorhizobium]|uniref:3-ketoacyl-ACP reductase n=1 Tax=unclassified Sinorhizobium TaxID=2613772 RepID=UPI003523A9D7